MDEEVNLFAFEGEERAAAWAAPIALERSGKVRVPSGSFIGDQDKQGAVDGVVRLVEGGAVQHCCPILKLELAGQVTEFHPPRSGWHSCSSKRQYGFTILLFANLLSDADKRTLHRAITVAPEVYFGRDREQGSIPSGRLENSGVSPTTTRSAKLPAPPNPSQELRLLFAAAAR